MEKITALAGYRTPALQPVATTPTFQIMANELFTTVILFDPYAMSAVEKVSLNKWERKRVRFASYVGYYFIWDLQISYGVSPV